MRNLKPKRLSCLTFKEITKKPRHFAGAFLFVTCLILFHIYISIIVCRDPSRRYQNPYITAYILDSLARYLSTCIQASIMIFIMSPSVQCQLAVALGWATCSCSCSHFQFNLQSVHCSHFVCRRLVGAVSGIDPACLIYDESTKP